MRMLYLFEISCTYHDPLFVCARSSVLEHLGFQFVKQKRTLTGLIELYRRKANTAFNEYRFSDFVPHCYHQSFGICLLTWLYGGQN